MFSPLKRVIACILKNQIIPILSHEIVGEYNTVLNRPKFKLEKETINKMLEILHEHGEYRDPTPYENILPDPKDRIFYEISLTGDNFLVTGNLKHFPSTPKVVSPAQMMEIIDAMYT
ncbi:MAG: putative toxin-antitoxin system toxin component, PIN family [Bacteroidales bacterium]|nr:putative toxin-antitoxin system toxin component, PIN family [Bacteroidales bacterium]